ncbi:hypothetical protein SLA2020_420710 [Shorea laevis]
MRNQGFYIFAHTVKDLVSALLRISAVGSSAQFIRTTWWVPLPDNETSTFHERSCADRTNWVRPRGILNSTNSFVWNSLRSGFRNPVSVLRPTS